MLDQRFMKHSSTSENITILSGTVIIRENSVIDRFAEEHSFENYACAYVDERLSRTPLGIELDQARRLILHWLVC